MTATKLPAPPALLFAEREARLAALDRLARPLWLSSLTHTDGAIESRLPALAALIDELAAGRLPAPADWAWPRAPLAAAAHDAMMAAGLAARCAGRRDLAELVALSLLFHLDFIWHYRDRGATPPHADAMAIEAFAADWAERCGEIDALREVFSELPEDISLAQWNALRGLLHSEAWQEVQRIRRLLEDLPELVRIIRALGRRQPSEHAFTEHTVAHTEELGLTQVRESRRADVRIPDLPGATRGVCRSGRIARMLPAEAMLLNHPRLRLVWHARRAERALLSYEDDERLEECHSVAQALPLPRPRPRPGRRAERGPIVLCVDTSGSMRGGAEAVAKAVVLEAMRSAAASGRACHLLAFGGAEEVIETPLPLNAAGIAAVTRFLGQSFHGGTDITGVLERALDKLESAAWRQADLLLASDGEFGATPSLVARLAAARRERGLFVQGVLIGDRETLGFLELADAILPITAWRRLGGEAVDAPIHSPKLTAMYFPGALRNPQTRETTVSGAVASEWVRHGRHAAPPTPETP